jgi:CHAD domain-containing protein
MAKKKDFEIRKRENFRNGLLRMLDLLHLEASRFIIARSRQHISIHEMRKNIKKIRAILRLLRHEIGNETYHELNDYYRTIARKVAILRDDTSQIELLENMKKEVDAPDIHKTLSLAIRQVEKTRKKHFNKFYQSGTQHEVRTAILEQMERNHDLDFNGDPDYFILQSLKRIHLRARSAMELSWDVKNDDVYHYMRKQVKYLMYQLMILNNAWPSYFRTYISELNKLSDLLGDLHDLNLFNEHVHNQQLVKLNPKQKKRILNHIYRQRAKLKKKIEKTSERLFSESSEAFSLRVYDIWLNSVLNKTNGLSKKQKGANKGAKLNLQPPTPQVLV